MNGCAQIGVLYDDPELYGIRLHQVPRSLFDLIPGEARTIVTGGAPLLVKSMFLAGEPGQNVKLTVFCSGHWPSLRETEPKFREDAPLSIG
jgi:hypothetical protein